MKKIKSDDEILKTVTEIIYPFILLLAIYIILNGHLSPGGGFSGGTVLGAALILHRSAFEDSNSSKSKQIHLDFSSTLAIITISLTFYGLAKGYSFMMGAADLDTGIGLGRPAAILSGGLILPLNIGVGLVVALVIYGFYQIFTQGDI